MHGRLFEIRENRLPEDEWMCVEHFYEEDTSSWCDWMQDSECREDDLEWLNESLPSSIFKVEGDEIEIISDGKDFVEGWISEVKKKVDELTYESFTSFMSTWYIRNKLKNMIDSDFMFKTDYEDSFTTRRTLSGNASRSIKERSCMSAVSSTIISKSLCP